MLKKHAQIFELLFVITDLLVVTFCWLISYWIRFELGVLPIDKGVPPFRDYLPLLLFVWLIWHFVYRKSGLYRPKRGQSLLREMGLLIKANLLGVIFLLAVTYLFKEKTVTISRLVFAIFCVLQISLSLLVRMFLRKVLRRLRKEGFNIRYSLIVGAGPLAQSLAARFRENREFGMELIGFLSSEDRGELNPLFGPLIAPIVGTYEDLSDIIASRNVDQIIVALPLSDHHRLADVVNSIGDEVMDVKLVPDIHQFIQLGSEVEEFDGIPVVSLASTPLEGANKLIKRGVDIILGTCFFIIFSPIMLVIAIIVKLGSRGPVFYRQERVGLDGESFQILKFRTMLVESNSDKPKFTTKNDARVTGVGKFLRRWSLDELPQLINVMAGQMSLVGPRPERPVFIKDFRKRIPKYMLRHKVKAGMTGWAQINGWRGNTSIEKRIEYDLHYIENWSIGLDIRILILTLFRGFKNRNAY